MFENFVVPTYVILSTYSFLKLKRIAEVLDVSVEELLGAEIKTENDKNEIAEQLSRINEQFVIKNRRQSRFWKIVGIILTGYLILNLLGYIMFSFHTSSSSSSVEIEETTDDSIE